MSVQDRIASEERGDDPDLAGADAALRRVAERVRREAAAGQGLEAFRAGGAARAPLAGAKIRRGAGMVCAAGLMLLMGLPDLSQAARRGSLICDEPESAYNSARFYPDDLDYWVGKGMCLIAEGKDAQGLEELRMASENNIPYAAFLRAIYRKTSGTFEGADFFQPDLTPAIRSYERAWMLAMNIDYHNEENLVRKLAEENELIILSTGYNLPVLHFYRYWRGAIDHTGHLVSKSPSKTQTEFQFYPKERGLTMQSLSEMKRRAHLCRSLQYNAELWDRPVYEHFTGLCDILYETAEEAIPLERERLRLAGQCKEDIPKCPGYKELSQQIVNWFNETKKILIEKEDSF